MKEKISTFLTIIACFDVFASGFGLYEASAKTYALGGAVLGRAVDASANFHNPATLTDLDKYTITVGAMTEHPRAMVKVDDGIAQKMDSGVFLLPSFQLAIPLPAGFAFGLGMMPEYGLGSQYDNGWALCGSSVDTMVTSFTINPNVAYKITDKWSVGAGLRFLYFDFEQYTEPLRGRVFNRLKGDNKMKDFGYQIGTKYDVFDNFSVGIVYKSLTVVNVNGKSDTDGLKNMHVPASTDLELPQSISGGFNWDITDEWHLGGVVAWTQWSSIDTLLFNLGGVQTPCELEWNDTWRAGFAPRWDFAEDWSWMASYVYENDCCGDQKSTMLPAADRHMISTGFSWEFLENFELAITYGIIIMDGCDSQAYNGSNDGATKKVHKYHPYRGVSHATGISLTYRF